MASADKGLFGLFKKEEKVDIKSLVKPEEPKVPQLNEEKLGKIQASVGLITEELGEVWEEIDALKKSRGVNASQPEVVLQPAGETSELRGELEKFSQELREIKRQLLANQNLGSQLAEFKSKLVNLKPEGAPTAESQFMKVEVGQLWDAVNKLSSDIAASKAKTEPVAEQTFVQKELERIAGLVDELHNQAEEEHIFSKSYLNRDEFEALERSFLKSNEFKKFIDFYNAQLDQVAHKQDVDAVNRSMDFLLDWNKKFITSFDQHSLELRNLLNLLIETNKQLKDLETSFVLLDRRLSRMERFVNAKTVIE